MEEAMAVELVSVVRLGSVHEFKKLEKKLASNLLLTAVTSESAKNTILHVAAMHGHYAMVGAMLQNQSLRPLLRAQNARDDTPTHLAAAAGHANMITSLLKHCDPTVDRENGAASAPHDLLSARNDRGNTPLHEAARKGHAPVLDLLLKTLDPKLLLQVLNEDNKDGETPLTLAILSKSPSSVETILKAKPDIPFKLRGPHNHTLLHLAILKDDRATMHVILRYRPELTKARDTRGRTPLHYAAALGLYLLVRALLTHDSSTAYLGDHTQMLPIHLAAENNDHAGVIFQFYQNNPYVTELTDGSRRHVLHIAAMNGKRDIVSYLMGLPKMDQVLLNSVDEDGNTPLLLAAKKCHKKIVDILSKDPRVDVCVINQDGQNVVDMMSTVHQVTSSSDTEDRNPRHLQEENPEDKARVMNLRFRVIKESENLDDMLKVKPHICRRRSIDQKQKDLAMVVMLVATLVSTVTFAVVFQIPGGYMSSDGPKKGMAVLSTSNNYGFMAFALMDVMAMVSSMGATLLLLGAFAGDDRATFNKVLNDAMVMTWYALLLMAGAFAAGMFTVLTENKVLAILVLAAACALPLSLPGLLWDLFWHSKGVRAVPKEFMIWAHGAPYTLHEIRVRLTWAGAIFPKFVFYPKNLKSLSS